MAIASTLQLPALTPAMSFDQASRAVTAYLRQVMPWGSWSIGRLADGVQTHIFVNADGYDLEEGAAVPVRQTLCQHMLSGAAPNMAPDAMAIPVLRENAEALGIGAYAGVPITEADGSVFGVLCGLSDHVEQATETDTDLLNLLAGLLGIVLAADRGREIAARHLAEAQMHASTDGLTGLPNRRAWNRHVEDEVARHVKFGDPTAVAIIDLDGLKSVNDRLGHAAGDGYIVAAGKTMRRVLTKDHLVARIGGDEFSILFRGVGLADTAQLVDDIERDLESAGVSASIGWAPVASPGAFSAALGEADRAMYARKQRRREEGATTQSVGVTLPDIPVGLAFDEAAKRIIDYLHTAMPWGFWSIGRINGDVQTHMYCEPNDVGIKHGMTLPLEDTICSQMLVGAGPHVVPDVAFVPAYAAQPVAMDHQVAAYAGMPIHEADGQLFGVLCGVSRNPESGDVEQDELLLTLLVGLLGSALATDRQRHAEELGVLVANPTSVDRITGLPNSDAWTDVVAHVETARTRFGDDACAIRFIVRGDVAPSNVVMMASAAVLRRVVGPGPLLGRPGPATLGLLLVGDNVARQTAIIADVVAGLLDVDVEVDVDVDRHLESAHAGDDLGTG